MVRISIPTLPLASGPILPRPKVSLPEAASILQSFLTAPSTSNGKGTAVLTGAGVSVDSGIRAYRGQDGRYMNPNYQSVSAAYTQLVAPSSVGYKFRQRYWARSYLGYPPVRDAKPNATHYALSLLHHASTKPSSTHSISSLVTQNVDGLHLRAGFPSQAVTELHGTLFVVRCKRAGHIIDRDEFQEMLGLENPGWKEFVLGLGTNLRTNPDGDIELVGKSYDDFTVPLCPTCLRDDGVEERTLKPDVVFFGESVPEKKKNQALDRVAAADRLLVIGTTLATYSAFRLFQLAHNAHKPILILNLGPTRADTISSDTQGGIVTKLEVPCGEVLKEVAEQICAPLSKDDNVGQEILDKLRGASVASPTFIGPEMKSS